MSDKFLIIILCFVLIAGTLMVLTTADNVDGENQPISVFLDDKSSPDQEVATN